MHEPLRGIASVLVALQLAGCGFDERHRTVTPFVIACEGEGNTYVPESGDRVDPEVRIGELLAAVDAEFAARAAAHGDVGERRRIVVHIHGGLNSPSDSLHGAYRSLLRMRAEPRGSPDYCVPIFVTWESGLWESYNEHLFKLRNGRHEVTGAVFSAPFWLLCDVLTGVVDTPRTLITRLYTDLGLVVKVVFDRDMLPSWRNAGTSYEQIRSRCDPPICRLGDYSRSGWSQAVRFVWYWVTLAPSIVVTSVAVDGPGTGAWEAMRHRAANLTHKYGEFKHEGSGETDGKANEATGTVAQLLHALRERIGVWRNCYPGVTYEVVLVGHSMGTIVLNDAVRDLHHVEKEHRSDGPLPVRHIVYMAAACSTQDVLRTIVPYLEDRPDTWFHALTLHPMAEVDEQNYLDFAPRGSLLVWIDNWYTQSATPVELRFGKWINLLQTIRLFHTVGKRMTVKGFAVDGSDIPQKHGDFNQCPFWRESFWRPWGPMHYPARWDDREGENPGLRY